METNSENTSTPRNGSWSTTNAPSLVTGIIFCSAFLLEAVLIAIGNLLTIVLFAINRNFRKKSLLLVVNMACADLMLGTVTLPMNTYLVGGELKLWFYKRDTTSKIFYRVLDDVFMQASILSAALISAERFYAIRWPLKHRVLSTRVYHIAISITWAAALLVSAILSLLSFSVSLIKSIFTFLAAIHFGPNVRHVWLQFKHLEKVSTWPHLRDAKQQSFTKSTLGKDLVIDNFLCITLVDTFNHNEHSIGF